MITAIRSLFVLSLVAICWWTFVWPFVVSADEANSIYHYGSIATLLVFFGCIVVLLAIQVYSRDEGNN
jgi:hypothetical protein